MGCVERGLFLNSPRFLLDISKAYQEHLETAFCLAPRGISASKIRPVQSVRHTLRQIQHIHSFSRCYMFYVRNRRDPAQSREQTESTHHILWC